MSERVDPLRKEVYLFRVIGSEELIEKLRARFRSSPRVRPHQAQTIASFKLEEEDDLEALASTIESLDLPRSSCGVTALIRSGYDNDGLTVPPPIVELVRRVGGHLKFSFDFVAFRIWLDDLRPAPEGWVWVKSAAEAIEQLEAGGVISISLDHDLGDDEGLGTGYDVARWIEEAAFHGRLAWLRWAVHSANPVGIERMTRALENADRFWARA